ncbi:MAG: hypothetical protein LBC31_09700 [Treponema sp.]|jgi:hypothetical protein|nr:hypothetical protein [Treponema sp.]
MKNTVKARPAAAALTLAVLVTLFGLFGCDNGTTPDPEPQNPAEYYVPFVTGYTVTIENPSRKMTPAHEQVFKDLFADMAGDANNASLIGEMKHRNTKIIVEDVAAYDTSNSTVVNANCRIEGNNAVCIRAEFLQTPGLTFQQLGSPIVSGFMKLGSDTTF